MKIIENNVVNRIFLDSLIDESLHFQSVVELVHIQRDANWHPLKWQNVCGHGLQQLHVRLLLHSH